MQLFSKFFFISVVAHTVAYTPPKPRYLNPQAPPCSPLHLSSVLPYSHPFASFLLPSLLHSSLVPEPCCCLTWGLRAASRPFQAKCRSSRMWGFPSTCQERVCLLWTFLGFIRGARHTQISSSAWAQHSTSSCGPSKHVLGRFREQQLHISGAALPSLQPISRERISSLAFQKDHKKWLFEVFFPQCSVMYISSENLVQSVKCTRKPNCEYRNNLICSISICFSCPCCRFGGCSWQFPYSLSVEVKGRGRRHLSTTDQCQVNYCFSLNEAKLGPWWDIAEFTCNVKVMGWRQMYNTVTSWVLSNSLILLFQAPF